MTSSIDGLRHRVDALDVAIQELTRRLGSTVDLGPFQYPGTISSVGDTIDFATTWVGGGALSNALPLCDYWMSQFDVESGMFRLHVREEGSGIVAHEVGYFEFTRTGISLDQYHWDFIPTSGETIHGGIRLTVNLKNDMGIYPPLYTPGVHVFNKEDSIFGPLFVNRLDLGDLEAFRKSHVRIETVLPDGIQDGAHTTFTCPDGFWMTDSVVAFINGIALPDEWIVLRTDTTITLGGAMPPDLWPDVTIPDKRELRVSYDKIVAPSGTPTPSGSGEVVYEYIDMKSAETLLAGMFVNFLSPTGVLEARKACASGELRADGYILTGHGPGDTVRVWLTGTNTKVLSPSGLDTTKTLAFLSTTPGYAMTDPSVLGSGQIIQELGVVVGASGIYTRFSEPILLHG
jgi:hypothetical protein